ncbi:MAG: transposase [Methylobacterium organophilum]|nr:transposase [Methylobacterium organophilum]
MFIARIQWQRQTLPQQVLFRVEVEPSPVPEPLRPAIGIDLGLITFAVSKDGA